MEIPKEIKLYMLSLYFISNFLFAISILFYATSIYELTSFWGFQAVINLVMIIIGLSIANDEEERQKEELKK